MQQPARDEFTLRIYVTPPEHLDDAVPTAPFQRRAMRQLLADDLKRQRVQQNRRRVEWAKMLLLRFGFGLPGSQQRMLDNLPEI